MIYFFIVKFINQINASRLEPLLHSLTAVFFSVGNNVYGGQTLQIFNTIQYSVHDLAGCLTAELYLPHSLFFEAIHNKGKATLLLFGQAASNKITF